MKEINVNWMNGLLSNILSELGSDYDKYQKQVDLGILKEVVRPFMFSMYQKNYRGFKYQEDFLKENDNDCEFRHFRVKEECAENQFRVNNVYVYNKRLEEYVNLTLHFNEDYITGISSEVELNDYDFNLENIVIK